jgi:hypothetical protein
MVDKRGAGKKEGAQTIKMRRTNEMANGIGRIKDRGMRRKMVYQYSCQPKSGERL